MVSAERQTIIETNKSLRRIKEELESLLEKGVLDDNAFDTIHAALPAESPLSGPLRTSANSNNVSHATSPAPTSPPPTQAFQNLSVSNPPPSNSQSPAPPSYADTPAPNVPNRNAGKPIIANARALYRYAGSDARDVSFEKDDPIAVHEYMNQDWWMGLNQRTGQEGIFPRNYVLVEQDNKGPAQPMYGYPNQNGPPAQQNPYNSNVPPMAVAEGGSANGPPSKTGEYGKKFGKKLGNAAIFGAGATIGGNLVNSIF